MKTLVSALLFVFLNASNCTSDRSFKEFKFGEGGGFTGAVTVYRVKDNGDLYKLNSAEQEEELIKSVTADEIQIIRDKLSKVPKEALNVNHPYNMYYFVKIDTMK